MEYSHIPDLIDGYLDILHQARKILVQNQFPRGTRPASTRKRRAMRSKNLLLTKSDFSAPQPEGGEIAFAPKEHSRSSASHGTSQRQISVSDILHMLGVLAILRIAQDYINQATEFWYR
jgi:hypothetical protein